VVTVRAEIAHAIGVEGDAVEGVVSPRGDVLYGVWCGPDECWGLWRKLRRAGEKSAWWPFVSHDGPGEWEWDVSRAVRESHGFSEASGVTPTRLVAAQEDVLADAAGLEGRLGKLAPRQRGTTVGEFFPHRPEWVCVAEIREQFRIPEVLDAPSTPNWVGSSAHPALGYEDHADVLRAWSSRYDASVCYLGSNALMLEVGRPPRSPHDVAAAATEQYAYCYDLDQVIGSIDDVAREQACADQWFFWWD
jgi:hypothetical protein